MNLTYTPLQTIGFVGLVIMAVLGIVQWGVVDIRLVFGVISIVVGLTFSYLIGKEILVDIQTIRHFKRTKKEKGYPYAPRPEPIPLVAVSTRKVKKKTRRRKTNAE